MTIEEWNKTKELIAEKVDFLGELFDTTGQIGPEFSFVTENNFAVMTRSSGGFVVEADGVSCIVPSVEKVIQFFIEENKKSWDI